MDRKARDLLKIEKREVASLKRDDLGEQRMQERGRSNAMASLEQVAGLETPPQRHEVEDLQTIFVRATDRKPDHRPDLLDAFNRAADDRKGDVSGGDEREPDIGHEPDEPYRGR